MTRLNRNFALRMHTATLTEQLVIDMLEGKHDNEFVSVRVGDIREVIRSTKVLRRIIENLRSGPLTTKLIEAHQLALVVTEKATWYRRVLRIPPVGDNSHDVTLYNLVLELLEHRLNYGHHIGHKTPLELERDASAALLD